MIEKVNPYHPDKVADRIAGAIVDLAYTKQENPKVAVECLLGHGECSIIIESSVKFTQKQIEKIVHRIAGEDITVVLKVVPQDEHLADNQKDEARCGDNGIFKSVPLSVEEVTLSEIARDITTEFPYDGKYIYDSDSGRLIICQSNMTDEEVTDLKAALEDYYNVDVTINPLGQWTGGLNTDTGAVNRKLGSDMARGVSGGGLHGKDLTKMDVSANIYAFMKSQEYNKPVELFCAIGDKELVCRINGKDTLVSVDEVINYAKDVINGLGGFESFAEWGMF